MLSKNDRSHSDAGPTPKKKKKKRWMEEKEEKVLAL